MNAEDLIRRLKLRYAYPEFAFFTNVYRPTKRGVRYADALALNLWSTRGLAFHGFEIKVDRRDWLRELKNPAKSDEIATYCDHWWLVVPDKDFVKEGELPEPWGMIVASGESTRVVKQAPKLDAVPLDRKFVSVLIRHFYDDHTRRAHTDEVLKAERDAGYEAGRKSADSTISWLQRDLENQRKAIETFQAASGVEINAWNGERVGDAVRMVLSGHHLKFTDRLRGLIRSVDLIKTDIEKALEGTDVGQG